MLSLHGQVLLMNKFGTMRRLMTHFLAIIFLASAALDVTAQGMLAEHYNVQYLNMNAGLPNNFVDDIYNDSYGFVWISTHGGGLVRYDGYTFLNFGIGSRGLQLKSNTCRNVCEDSFHRLWISYEECTDVLDLSTMHQVVPQCKKVDLGKILSGRSIRVYKDTRGKMWLVTMDKIYCITFDAEGNIDNILNYRYVSNTPDITIRDIDANGSVWVATGGTLFRLAMKGGKLQRSSISHALDRLPVNYISDVLKIKNKVWIGTNLGLFQYDTHINKVVAFHHSSSPRSLSHDYIASLAASPDGRLLVGTLCGVDIFQEKGNDFDHWNTSSAVNPLSSNFVNCILCVKGHLWVGTETGGIVLLLPRSLELHNYVHQSDAASISSGCVNSMYVQPDGTLWVGTVEGGLNRLQKGGNTFTHYTAQNTNLSHNSVSTLAADAHGHLWIGTWGGGINSIDIKNPSQVTRLTVQPKLQPLLNFIGALAYDRYNDGLWIGSNDGIFFYNFKTHQLELPFQGCGNIRGCIGSIIDRSGTLWMGCLVGVVQINLKSRHSGRGFFKYRQLKNKLDNPSSGIIDKITCFCQCRDGSLWLGSNGYGLYRRIVKDGRETFHAYTMKDGLANNSVKGIAEDSSGSLWITTDHGLSQMNPRTGVFTNYFEEDGLVSSQFYWNSAIRSADGTMYFGTDKGLIAFSGENVASVCRGRLRFTGLMVDNQDVMAGSRYVDADIAIAREIRLRESDKSLTIEFSALNYGNETQGVYSYRMHGFEDDWTQLPPGEHSVRYTSLPPGHYRFEVKYSSAQFSGNDNTISVDVDVTPYFWKSWWFVSIMLIFLAVLASYIYRRRMIIMKRREAERLFRPIEAALSESEDPEMLQQRIQGIIDNHRLYKESQDKSVEADREAVGQTKPFMDRLMEVLEQNYADSEFGVTELSDAMGMNKTALSKRINTETGLPTSQFIRNYRLDISKKLILQNDGNRNITEIAYSVGFNDPKYFTRCFTKLYGTSPSSYKAETDVEE